MHFFGMKKESLSLGFSDFLEGHFFETPENFSMHSVVLLLFLESF
jgi:hypothetical protein